MSTKKRADPDLEVHTFSDNPFEDLGLPNAAELLARTDLAVILTREIRRRKLTQTRAADLLGISQSDVSSLMRGDVRGFSQERITRLLTRLDLDVDIQVRPKKQKHATVRVRDLFPKIKNPEAVTAPVLGARAWAHARKTSTAQARASTASPRKRTTTKRQTTKRKN